MVDYADLFTKLVQAETEDLVEDILRDSGYLGDDESMWLPLGDFENNFSAVGNQQDNATAALIEKIINAIDAVLMARCFEQGVDPEGHDAPQSMAEAVEQFFGVREGRISTLDARQRQQLADNIHLVAVGSKGNPNYLIIDRGEGQTPARFSETFVSIMKSNKMRIPFVQGKFNTGGLGILQFCGNQNYQLIASRRHPTAPVRDGDATSDLWGFTLVRRLRPTRSRPASMYVYLAPGREVPSFAADGIRVLPGPSRAKLPGEPYAVDLPYGTCLKLYNFKWGRAKTLITLDARYELERLLHTPALPFRLDETRHYSGNSYSTTVSGGWDAATTGEEEGESAKLEEGFPAYAELRLPDIGVLPYRIAVYKEGTDKRRVPYGVFFVVNGQVHGSLPADFVSRRLKFDYLTGAKDRGPLLVSVDCTGMEPNVREDFFMSSRDRVRRNDSYTEIEQRITEELRNHSGLKDINALRRQRAMERPLDEEATLSAFQQLIDDDPSLASLFSGGDRLVTRTGPGERPPYIGRQFPNFFRLAKEPASGLTKTCPVNQTCRIEFETDAVNDYFKRLDSPGRVTIDPPNLLEHQGLWNGRWSTRFSVPWDAQIGDAFQVTVSVTDVEQDMRGGPFVSSFSLVAGAPLDGTNPPGPKPKQRSPQPNGRKRDVALSLPQIQLVSRADWERFDPPFHSHEALRVKHDGEDGYDYYVNVDNAYLLTELDHAKDDDKPRVRFWFNHGLVIAAVGLIKHGERRTTNHTEGGSKFQSDIELQSLDDVNEAGNGLARVIVPLIRSLSQASIAGPSGT